VVVHLVVAKSDANCFGILGKVASPVPAGGSAQLGCTICLRLVKGRGGVLQFLAIDGIGQSPSSAIDQEQVVDIQIRCVDGEEEVTNAGASQPSAATEGPENRALGWARTTVWGCSSK